MIVKIKDLQIGDEIVVSSYSSVIFGKLIRRTKKGTAVISTKMDRVESTSTYAGRTYKYTEKTYTYAPASEHNTIKYFRNYGDAWVVKRDGIRITI